MKPQSRSFLVWSTVVIAVLGALGFFAVWFSGKKEVAIGIAIGAGIGLLEMESTGLIFPRVMAAGSKAFWGIALGTKSLLIFTLIGVLILGLKINPFGFIIGFSEAILGILLTVVGQGPGPKEEKG